MKELDKQWERLQDANSSILPRLHYLKGGGGHKELNAQFKKDLWDNYNKILGVALALREIINAQETEIKMLAGLKDSTIESTDYVPGMSLAEP